MEKGVGRAWSCYRRRRKCCFGSLYEHAARICAEEVRKSIHFVWNWLLRWWRHGNNHKIGESACQNSSLLKPFSLVSLNCTSAVGNVLITWVSNAPMTSLVLQILILVALEASVHAICRWCTICVDAILKHYHQSKELTSESPAGLVWIHQVW